MIKIATTHLSGHIEETIALSVELEKLPETKGVNSVTVDVTESGVHLSVWDFRSYKPIISEERITWDSLREGAHISSDNISIPIYRVQKEPFLDWKLLEESTPLFTDAYYLFGGYTGAGKFIFDKYYYSLKGMINGWSLATAINLGNNYWCEVPEPKIKKTGGAGEVIRI